ncbi:CAP domain-containing protein [Priestia megaterium]|uniref:CAP domain-containing protein n=1 Tax=Priestia megaterium TaxID=1404 RepID=UPI003D2BD7E0
MSRRKRRGIPRLLKNETDSNQSFNLVQPPSNPIDPPLVGCTLDTPEKQALFKAHRQFLPSRRSDIDNLSPDLAVIEYTNLLRDNMGIPRLIRDPGLSFGAQFKADEMQKFNYFSHEFNGRDQTGLALELSRNYPNSGILTNCIWENIAYGQADAYTVFSSWFCSSTGNPDQPGHFENMTNPQLNRIGVGFAQGNPPKWAMWLSTSGFNNNFNCRRA